MTTPRRPKTRPRVRKLSRKTGLVMTKGNLTARQLRFATLIVAGHGIKEAYRAAYDCVTAAEKTIAVKASEVRRLPKVDAEIERLRKPEVEEAQLDLRGHLRALKRLRDRAVEIDQLAAAISAERARGEVSGLYKKIIEGKVGLSLERLVSGMIETVGEDE